MTENGKFPTCDASQVGNASGKSGETISENDSTMSYASSQGGGRIWRLLPEGEALAIPGPMLASMIGVTPRTMRHMIDRERENGALILASDDGYFRPADGPAGLQELRRFVRRQDSRCAANRRTIRSARAALRAMEKAPLDGQMEIQIGGNGDG